MWAMFFFSSLRRRRRHLISIDHQTVCLYQSMSDCLTSSIDRSKKKEPQALMIFHAHIMNTYEHMEMIRIRIVEADIGGKRN